MSDNITKLDQIDKKDPELHEKTSELITRRAEEEKRKAELRKEMQMAKARADAKAKKGGSTPEVTPEVAQTNEVIQPTESAPPTTQETSPSNPNDFITVKKFQETLVNVNRSFSWLENYIKEQNTINAKMSKFIVSLSKAIEEYNKK